MFSIKSFTLRQSAACCLARRGLTRHRNKVVGVADAVELVKDEDAVFVGGFVCQGIAESVLRALEEKYVKTGHPKNLTLMFYGVGDPKGKRGTNHFAPAGMVKRVIAAHFGQAPDLVPRIISNEIEAYAVPMGNLSRMLQSRASGSPGHFTRVGLGTFIDPRLGGGRMNAKTVDPIVELVTIDDAEYLRYKSLRIAVAIVRATSADPIGNLSCEKESVSPDLAMISAATRASGGVVIAQVERIVAKDSLSLMDVKVPSNLVTCVVKATEKADSSMSMYTEYNPAWSGEIRANFQGEDLAMPFSARKIIARRAAKELSPDDVVNLGIGLPEGVSRVCAEEGILDNLVLTTEAGMIGGLPASGTDFGPSANATCRLDLHQQFNFYTGGGLDICFLGCGEVDSQGNVNVHKLSDSSLTGPGGFIDISQSTRHVIFVGTFTKKGLEVSSAPGPEGVGHRLSIDKEGEVPMFKKSLRAVTFSGAQAIRNGQHVMYVTERAVFSLDPSGALRLIEVAPGIDIDRDILPFMEFKPLMDRAGIVEMDPKIFGEKKMSFKSEFFRDHDDFAKRIKYNQALNTVFIDFGGLYIREEEDLDEVVAAIKEVLEDLTEGGTKKVKAVISYDGADVTPSLIDQVYQRASEFEKKYYLVVRRIGGKAFIKSQLAKDLKFDDEHQVLEELTGGDPNAVLSRAEFRDRVAQLFGLHLSVAELQDIFGSSLSFSRGNSSLVVPRLVHLLQEPHLPSLHRKPRPLPV